MTPTRARIIALMFDGVDRLAVTSARRRSRARARRAGRAKLPLDKELEMLYSEHVGQKQFNPFGSGREAGRQRHFEPVPVSLTYLPTSCQLATDTDSRCFFHVISKFMAQVVDTSRSCCLRSKGAQTGQASAELRPERGLRHEFTAVYHATQRAEPLARPCSFALPGRFTGGTRSGWPVGAVVLSTILVYIIPRASSTIEYDAVPTPQVEDCGSRSGDRTRPKRSPSIDVKHPPIQINLERHPSCAPQGAGVRGSGKFTDLDAMIPNWWRPVRFAETIPQAWGEHPLNRSSELQQR